jgi:hypothetical protein
MPKVTITSSPKAVVPRIAMTELSIDRSQRFSKLIVTNGDRPEVLASSEKAVKLLKCDVLAFFKIDL